MRTEKETQIRDIASAAIQATVIGIVIFLPKISSAQFLDLSNPRLDAVIGIFLIAGSIALILLSLTIFWKYIREHEQKVQSKESG